MLGMDDDSESDIRGLVSVYLAMTRMVDDGIGRILDKLEELGDVGGHDYCVHCGPWRFHG